MKVFLFIFLILIAPGVAFGVQDFVPLAPIPGLKIGPNTTLPEYINSVFMVIISVAAMLAVLRIVTGGFKYIVEESVSAKGEARGVIQGAIIGLLLLLGSWIILTTINPQIVDLSVLRFDKLEVQSPSSGGSRGTTPSVQPSASSGGGGTLSARGDGENFSLDPLELQKRGERFEFISGDKNLAEQRAQVCRNEKRATQVTRVCRESLKWIVRSSGSCPGPVTVERYVTTCSIKKI